MTPSSHDPVLQLLRQATKRGVFPGAVICASRRGEIRYTHAVGASTLRPHYFPLAAHALFDVASLTKPVATTAALMLLHDAGEIRLEQPASRFLPIFHRVGRTDITLRHLLNHCSGLPAHIKFYEALLKLRAEGGGPAMGEEALAWVIQEIATTPASPPETVSIYSDLGFLVLGAIIERITEVSLDTFCREKIFLPLGMETTFFLPLHYPEIRRRRIEGHQVAATEDCPYRGLLIGEVHDDNCHALGGIAGHAGLFSTAADLHRFAQTILACSQGEANFFQPATVEAFWTPQGIVPGSTWALGWDTPSEEGSQAGQLFSRNSVGHLGFTGCSLWIDRDEGIVCILLTNRVHPKRDNSEIRRFRPLLHTTVHGLVTTASPLPPPVKLKAAGTALKIDDPSSLLPRPGLLPPPSLTAGFSSASIASLPPLAPPPLPPPMVRTSNRSKPSTKIKIPPPILPASKLEE